jgi:hypothetical protein
MVRQSRLKIRNLVFQMAHRQAQFTPPNSTQPNETQLSWIVWLSSMASRRRGEV